MREICAYENEDGTFRVEIHDKVKYLSTKGTKEITDIIAEIPRAKISLDIFRDNTEENTLFTMELTDFKNKKT